MKKVLCGVCASLILASAGLTGAAASAQSNDAGGQIMSDQETGSKNGRPLTDEEKVKQEKIREALKTAREKWAGLTDEQKQQVYGLWDQSMSLNTQVIDKYVELGILDQDTASVLKEQLTDIQSKIRDNGKMPLYGYGGICREKQSSETKPESSTTASSAS